MIQYLKRGKPERDREQDDVKVRAVVEATLSEIERRGDAAVRALLEKFDRYSPPSVRFAGPAETMVITDETVDAEMCATDLLGQAEHGYNSPAVLLTNSRTLAERTLAEIERLLAIPPTRETTVASWRDYGEVICCDTYDEMRAVANDIASEHVQVMTDRNDWFLKDTDSYGVLYLGPRTNVANGDKVIGSSVERALWTTFWERWRFSPPTHRLSSPAPH